MGSLSKGSEEIPNANEESIRFLNGLLLEKSSLSNLKTLALRNNCTILYPHH